MDCSMLEKFISQSINFSKIIKRLERTESTFYAYQCVSLYIRFICLKLLEDDYHATKISPTKEIDLAWHNHVLDTKQYYQDCKNICGRFIHHDADGSEHGREARIKRTEKLFLECFGYQI